MGQDPGLRARLGRDNGICGASPDAYGETAGSAKLRCREMRRMSADHGFPPFNLQGAGGCEVWMVLGVLGVKNVCSCP